MPSCHPGVTRAAIRTAAWLLVVTSVATFCLVAQGQVTTTTTATRAVGGISIDPAGMAANATVEEFGALRQARLEIIGDVPKGLDRAADLRKVSLRRLDEAIRRCLEDHKQLPVEMECLGGLQRIRYLVVDPETHDIILAGPAESWKVDQRGAVVGEKTGRPVMMLDDLVVALRAAIGPQRSVITCSIDPTPEGLQRLNSYAKRIAPGADPGSTSRQIEQVLGPQTISVTGLPDTSHFARVMVAADYRMKRIGLGVEPSPVRGLPGIMELMRGTGRGMRNTLPRWWLTPDYQPLLRDGDGLTWELRGASVKAMTENDFLDAAGARRRTGRADPASQKWADLMTDHYDELAVADPVFGQLQNCMDMAIVAAIIAGNSLLDRAQLSLPMLTDSGMLQTAQFPAPKQAESKAAAARRGRWMISCGGVEINAWAMVEKAQQSDELAAVRTKAAMKSSAEQWWE